MAEVADPRKPRNRRHSLVYVLAPAACAVLTGASSLPAISKWVTGASAVTRPPRWQEPQPRRVGTPPPVRAQWAPPVASFEGSGGARGMLPVHARGPERSGG
ncbi:transposase family protein [Streptomyces rishiriensis]|uniref:transposase family protein n=1 Tax=Streptomyces rishiriensis TaxID=68264 RepID=UPI0027D8ED99|nr:transposase family protein [Streptomyces rishiriensis]